MYLQPFRRFLVRKMCERGRGTAGGKVKIRRENTKRAKPDQRKEGQRAEHENNDEIG